MIRFKILMALTLVVIDKTEVLELSASWIGGQVPYADFWLVGQ